MSYTERYIDTNGNDIKIGDRVNDGQDEGIILFISDPDGDVDDEGRPIFITPRAKVRFDNGEDEIYYSYWLGRFPDDDAPFQFDDLQLVKKEGMTWQD